MYIYEYKDQISVKLIYVFKQLLTHNILIGSYVFYTSKSCQEYQKINKLSQEFGNRKYYIYAPPEL